MYNVFVVFDGSTALEVFDPKEFNLENMEDEFTYYSIREQAIRELRERGGGELNQIMAQIFARNYAYNYAHQCAHQCAYYLNRKQAIQWLKERGEDDPSENRINKCMLYFGTHHIQRMKKRRTLREYEEDYQNEEI
ncbi:MAG: hypothetical protein HDT22_04940 [Ruminococcus sp.]|nr:hypothetical protein [Ruminococcus sp.]